MAPSRPTGQSGPRWYRAGSNDVQKAPKRPQYGTTWHEKSPKRTPGELDLAHSWPKMAPTAPRGRPKRLQREPNMGKRWPQGGPRKWPRRLKMAPRGPQGCPQTPKELPRKPNIGQPKTLKNEWKIDSLSPRETPTSESNVFEAQRGP